MEKLLDQCDALVQLAATSGELPHPDLPLPEELLRRVDSDSRTLREDPEKGLGWFATKDIPAGQLLMVAKPIASVMDWQEYDEGNDDEDDDHMADEVEPLMNELLLIAVLQKLLQDPTIWREQLSTLFPRNDSDLSTLPVWVCHNDEIFLQVEALLADLDPSLPTKDIAKRLPLIVRYNVLSMETCAELLSYPSPQVGHAALAGIALYHEPSFFNHSARPNVHRWCLGDVLGLVTNQPVAAGTEFTISYIEHDVLCEPAARRNALLSMDFHDDDDAVVLTGGPAAPVVDSDVQNELMGMDPLPRLGAIDALLQQARGAVRPPEAPPDAPIVPWFQCDVQNLRILQAITLEGLGSSAKAYPIWRECVQFVETHLPPADESLVVLLVQATLCAHHCGAEAVPHAVRAVQVHQVLFGGDVAWFRRRLRNDLRLALRPKQERGADEEEEENLVDLYWPLPTESCSNSSSSNN
jgi:SET domain